MMSAPNTMSGRRRRALVAEANGIGSKMAAFHALQDQIIAMLERQMHMRHQPFLLGNGSHQIDIGLDGVDRGDAKTR